jgi:hypothetical protein
MSTCELGASPVLRHHALWSRVERWLQERAAAADGWQAETRVFGEDRGFARRGAARDQQLGLLPHGLAMTG